MAKRSGVNSIPFWGAFATAALLPNVAASTTQTAQLEVGDQAYVTGTTQLYVCTTATLGAAVWAAIGAGSTLWRWNETDTTEWQISIDELAPGTTALSVQTPNRDGSPRLRVTFPTKVTGEQSCVLTVHGIDLTTLASKGSGRFRYVWEFDVIGASIISSEWYAIGPAFLCSDTTSSSFALGIGATVGGATRLIHLKSGTPNLSGSTPAWRLLAIGTAGTADCHDRFRVIVEAVKNPGSQPYLIVDLQLFGRIASQNPIPSMEPTDGTWDSISSFSTTWNAVTPATIGIFILGTTGTTASQYIEFANMRVSKHPMDL